MLIEPLAIGTWIDLKGYGCLLPAQILEIHQHPNGLYVYSVAQPGHPAQIASISRFNELPKDFSWERFRSYEDPYESEYAKSIVTWQRSLIYT